MWNDFLFNILVLETLKLTVYILFGHPVYLLNHVLGQLMGKRHDLAVDEKEDIVRMLANGDTTLIVAGKFKRDHRTTRKYVNASQLHRKRSDKGKPRLVSQKDLRMISRCTTRTPLSTSKNIYLDAGVVIPCRQTSCRLLKRFANMKSAQKMPPLKKRLK